MRAGPVAVTSTSGTVPTAVPLQLSYNAQNRQAKAQFNSQELSYTVPNSAPFNEGASVGMVAVGQNANYRLDNFQANYPAVGASEVTATPAITSDWGAGFSVVVTVETNSATPIPWTVEVDLSEYPLNADSISSFYPGTVAWLFEDSFLIASGSGDDAVSSSTSRTFGFNALRPPAPPAPAEYNYVIDNDWGSGYCATINVTTASPTPITWEVEVDMAAAPLNGTPGTPWNANGSFNATTRILTATGVAFNAEVSSSSPASFGFCANR